MTDHNVNVSDRIVHTIDRDDVCRTCGKQFFSRVGKDYHYLRAHEAPDADEIEPREHPEIDTDPW